MDTWHWISARVPIEFSICVRIAAAKRNVSKSDFIREAVAFYLINLGDNAPTDQVVATEVAFIRNAGQASFPTRDIDGFARVTENGKSTLAQVWLM